MDLHGLGLDARPRDRAGRCRARGHRSRPRRVRLLDYPGPEALSGPVADLYRTWLADAGTTTDRLLIESFLLIDPIRTPAAGLVPLWTVFSVEPALDAACRYLATTSPGYTTAHIGLFPHGVRSDGIALPDQWIQRIGRFVDSAKLLGVDARRYPADFAALARYGKGLRDLTPAPGPRPQPGSLLLDTAQRLLDHPKSTPFGGTRPRFNPGEPD